MQNKIQVTVKKDVAPEGSSTSFYVQETYEQWWDAGLEEWAKTFQQILIGLGYSSKRVRKMFHPDVR